MSNIANLIERQPHFNVQTADGNVHVFPMQCLRDVVSGKLDPVEALGPDVLRAILSDFLAYAEDVN